MTVTKVHKDADRLTFSITAEFEAPVARIWQLWDDPRRLERWWGPPSYPATFVEHQLTPGSRVTYYMTGPEGERYHGWWRIVTVEPPHHLEFEDGFSNDGGEPNLDMPTTVARVAIEERASGGTTMTIVSTFPSIEAMEQLVEMGMEEGMTAAMGQIDGLLAEDVRPGVGP